MKRSLTFSIVAILLASVPRVHADEASAAAPPVAADMKDAPAAAAAGGVDQSENNYYWQGTQLYNLGRLGEAFESFEKAIQRKQNTKESEAYLLQIRQEIVKNAQSRAKERSALNYDQGNSPDSALNVSYVQKGYTRVVLNTKFLFNENTASFKTGAIEVLNRLADLLDVKEGGRTELTVIDELDNNPGVRDIDAERALVLFAYVNFKRLTPQS